MTEKKLPNVTIYSKGKVEKITGEEAARRAKAASKPSVSSGKNKGQSDR